MATFVLVHGAWQGASTWDLVVPTLRAAGHQVYTPTLVGLGANAHRLTPQVNLDMHVQDVVGVINYERLQDVILVGHSYAGMIITGVAESVRERLARLVYVDAFGPRRPPIRHATVPGEIPGRIPRPGSIRRGWVAAAWQREAIGSVGAKGRAGVGFRPLEALRFLHPLLRAAPQAAHRRRGTLDRADIACVGEGYPARPIFAQYAERARAEGWRTHELPTGHDCHVEMPEAFSELLLELGGTRPR